MKTYPSTFPRHENTPGGEVGVGLRRTSVPVALANQEKAYNAPAIFLDKSFTMKNDLMLVWLDWMLKNGHVWFLMEVVSPYAPVNIYSEHRVRLVSPIQQEKLGDDWSRVSATFEVLPADREDASVPEPDYDWSDPGTPASPATDWADPGTLAAPATDWSMAHLYYWR